MITFVSIPALSVGVGAATMPIGLTMLGFGSITTGIGNNIWPSKFRPRNGGCGVDRSTLTQGKCIQLIGQNREEKSILKKSFLTSVSKSRFKQFKYQVLRAMPFCNQWGEYLNHENNIHRFNNAKSKLAETRVETLRQLIEIRGCSQSLETIQDQWKACQQLGIDQRILDVLVHNNHHSKPYCFKSNKTNSIWNCFGLVDKFKNKKNSSESPERNLHKSVNVGVVFKRMGIIKRAFFRHILIKTI